jgi:hypothetical protein
MVQVPWRYPPAPCAPLDIRVDGNLAGGWRSGSRQGTDGKSRVRQSGTWATGLIGCLGIHLAAAICLAQPPVEPLVRDVEAAFRDAMQMWAYKEFWRLWDTSRSESRFRISQKEFTAQMEKGASRPVAGGAVEDLRVSITTPQTAVVTARISVEGSIGRVDSVVRSFVFYHEEGRWRHELSDFLGLAYYRPYP